MILVISPIYYRTYLQYSVLLARFLRGQLQPVVFTCPVPQESRQNTLYLYVILHCNTLKKKALSYNLINITKLN